MMPASPSKWPRSTSPSTALHAHTPARTSLRYQSLLPRSPLRPLGLLEGVRAAEALHGGDAVSQGERDALRLGADADVARELAALVRLALHAHVDEGVLAEDGLGVEVGGEEVRRAVGVRGGVLLGRAGGLGGHGHEAVGVHLGADDAGHRREAAHVGVLHEVLQEGQQRREVRVHRDLVLPLELGPHEAEGLVRAPGGADVVHDVELDVVQVDVRALRRRRRVVHDGAEDVPRLRGRHLDVRADGAAVQRPDGVALRPLHELEVADGAQLHRQVRDGALRAVRDGDVQHDVVVVHRDLRLSVHRVRHGAELVHARELLRSLRRAVRARGLAEVVAVHQVQVRGGGRRPQLPEVDELVGLDAEARAVGRRLARLERAALVQQAREGRPGPLEPDLAERRAQARVQ
mmetsp:Transcript_29406/g.94414  ORF Transcript_29406/g.94414 Transcript_29406/m.94414 type:complete len:405 (-) Transcript_29406:115-1329(-)